MEKQKLELSVGIFLAIGLVCLGYLSFKLGDVALFGSTDYLVKARFANVSGLKKKGNVTMAGVPIGQVEDIGLTPEGQAEVTLRIRKDVKLEEDAIAAVKTSGIIGDKYIAVSPGGSPEIIPPGGLIRETLPPLDLEELLGKYVFGSVEKK